jgi:REP element-mobilizing transposase RayT
MIKNKLCQTKNFKINIAYHRLGQNGMTMVVDGQIHLSVIGKHLDDNLQNISTHYPYVEIPLFVVMPNHWHAVVFIDSEKTPYIRRNVADSQHSTVNETMQDIALINRDGYRWQSVVLNHL